MRQPKLLDYLLLTLLALKGPILFVAVAVNSVSEFFLNSTSTTGIHKSNKVKITI